MNLQILEKIEQLTKDIENVTDSSNELSIFTGISGLPIFYYLKYLVTGNEENVSKIHAVLERIFIIINESEIPLSYCNGISGVGHMLNYIEKTGILNPEAQQDIREALNDIDELIIEVSAGNSSSISDTDFLHGSFGAAFYLLERLKQKPEDLDFREKVIQLMETLADIVQFDIEQGKEVEHITEIAENLHTTNCGLAHGHISYILIFAKFLELVPDNDFVRQALASSVACILKFRSKDATSFAEFPSIAISPATANYSISLGWCYGDQTIALGLCKAAEILKNEELKTAATEIAYKSLERKTVDQIFPIPIVDGAFCHGLSSIAYNHKKWHKITKDPEFEKEYTQKINEILTLGNNPHGIGGYQKYMGKGEFEDAIGFLDGGMGIGVVLLDYLLGDKDYGWDNFFLLDNIN